MMRPPGMHGVAFTEAGDGDQRSDPTARREVASRLGISPEWATVRQVHGHRVIRAHASGEAGEGDALWTSAEKLPLAVRTADCFGIVLLAEGAVGVAHVGWRGAEQEVVGVLLREMEHSGFPATAAAVGPGIGPCCFEVGEEVAQRFEGFQATTSWGARSVDLLAVLEDRLSGLGTWYAGSCTRHEEGWFSHRRDRTAARLATIGWVT